jgi:heptosyltransferase-2
MEAKKILIIKMGYSETLDHEVSKVVSLGDVLRCSIVLEALKEKYPDSSITWLVSAEAIPLVGNNPYIDKVLVWDEFIPYVLMREKYDIVINLEKINGICALADMIDAWEKIGFRFNSQTGEFDTYMQSMVAKDYLKYKVEKGTRSIWQKVLIDMIGAQWKGQEYSLGYRPKSKETHDVGFNYYVGTKWPSKAMPERKWKELEAALKKDNISISWQQGMDNLYDYMDWINSCRVIVSNDSLGLHLALAFKKRLVALFGPTDFKEIYFYNRGVIITPKIPYDCMPCYLPQCKQDKWCMDSFMDIGLIAQEVKKALRGEPVKC